LSFFPIKLIKVRKLIIPMEKNFFTTTEASKLLSVSADTVLKWVRAGKIKSYRTPGGHCRIPKDAVSELLPELVSETADVPAEPIGSTAVYKFCWDFYAEAGQIQNQCLNCVAYKSGALRCYEMRDIPEEFGGMKTHCDENCDDCEYFRLTHGHATSALVVSHNEKLVSSLKSESDSIEIKLRFASGEYECAATIDKFRPDYVIIDCSFGTKRTREMCRAISNDTRIPYTRIILTSRSASVKECCDGEVFGWITKPFNAEQLQQLIDGSWRPLTR